MKALSAANAKLRFIWFNLFFLLSSGGVAAYSLDRKDTVFSPYSKLERESYMGKSNGRYRKSYFVS